MNFVHFWLKLNIEFEPKLMFLVRFWLKLDSEFEPKLVFLIRFWLKLMRTRLPCLAAELLDPVESVPFRVHHIAGRGDLRFGVGKCEVNAPHGAAAHMAVPPRRVVRFVGKHALLDDDLPELFSEGIGHLDARSMHDVASGAVGEPIVSVGVTAECVMEGGIEGGVINAVLHGGDRGIRYKACMRAAREKIQQHSQND